MGGRSFPDGGHGTLTRQESTFPFSTTLSRAITSALNLTNVAVFDGFGRVKQTQLTSDVEGTTDVDTTYDGLGRISTVSNPHRSSTGSTDGITTTIYDALSRVCVVVPPDGTVPTGGTCPAIQPVDTVFTTYLGNCDTVTDEAGKSHRSCADGLGRLTQVFEDPSASNLETDYTYDAIGNLVTVNQKGGTTTSSTWRTRTFTYNSLSQLLTAVNPESGTVNYSYDANGNLLTKISPAPNQTGSATVTATYTYDSLNRVTQKSFSNGSAPTVKYGYDAIAPAGCTPPALTINNGTGRRTSMCDAAGAEAWGLDLTTGIGWKTTDVRTTNNVTKTTIVQNNFSGPEATLSYPSGRVITYTPSGAGRILSAVDVANSVNYASTATYAPQGALSSLTNGASLVSTLYYNDRLQPCRISVKSTGTAAASCTDAANTGNILDYSYNFGLGVSNNGNVTAIANSRDNTRSQNFTYDALNRVASAQTQTTGVTIPNANCWGLTFGYDPWGNLLQSSATGPTGCGEPTPLNITVSTSNRVATSTVAGQISNYCY